MSFVEDLNKKSIISILDDFKWFYVWLVFSFVPQLSLLWFGDALKSSSLDSLILIWSVFSSVSYLSFSIYFKIRMKETLFKWSKDNWLHIVVPSGVATLCQLGFYIIH